MTRTGTRGLAICAIILGTHIGYAQPAPAVYEWSWNPNDALVRVEAQVLVDESACSNVCFDNNVAIQPWPICPIPGAPPLPWPWSILPPVPPPAPPVPPLPPPLDWDEYPPLPPPAELGTLFIGDYCPCPTSDAQGNPPIPPPLDPINMTPKCALDWFQRVNLVVPTGLTFQNMLGHPSVMPERQVVNDVFASDGDVPHATIPCFNAPFVPPGVEVTGQAQQVLTVRGQRGLIGTVANYGVRTWELRFNNRADNYAVMPVGADRFVSEGCATIVTQIPLEITGLTPGVPARFTFEFQTLGESDSFKEDHPFLDPGLNALVRPDSDNAYALATVDLYVHGIWSTQFIEYVGDAPGLPPVPSPHGGQGAVTFVFHPSETTLPVVLRLTSRARTYIEDDGQGALDKFDQAMASIRANVWLTVFGPAVVGQMEMVSGGGAGPAYDFWMSKYEVTNVEFVDFLNDAEQDAAAAGGGTEISDFMVFDPTTGQVSTPGGELMFDPILSPTPGGSTIPKIRYRPLLPAGSRYVVDSGAEPDAVVGVTWIGALKYCNWLTLYLGYPPADRCYTEGADLGDWHPVTISTADWATGDLNAAQRAALVANYRGFRLPMDNVGATLGYISNQANAYNEWYKAAAYDPSAPNFARTGPGGETVPALHRFYGFGRDGVGRADANYLTSGDPFDDGVAHAGFFDGTNALTDGTSTNDTSNPYGLYDLSGNVDEWGQDQGPGFQIGMQTLPGQITRSGTWQDSDVQSAASRRGQASPSTANALLGFRVITTNVPPAAPQPCPGDLNDDGIVDLTDLALCLSLFDQPGGCDLTGLAILLANFGQPCP